MKIKKKNGRSLGGNMMVYIVLICFGVFFALPLVLAIVTSFKPFEEIFIFPPRFYVRNPTLDNFSTLFLLAGNSLVPFSRYIVNSLFLSVSVTLLSIIVSSAAAYPLAKNDFPGKRAISGVVVSSLLFVPAVTSVPAYMIIAKLGLLNTYAAVILPGLGASFGVFLMKQFMEGIPYSIIEATKIDGGSEYTILFRVVMPIIQPAWLTLAIFSFQSSWGNGGLGFIFDERLKFLPTAITELTSGNLIARMGVSSAAAVILMIPPIVFFVFSQSRILETMAHAGIKE